MVLSVDEQLRKLVDLFVIKGGGDYLPEVPLSGKQTKICRRVVVEAKKD